MKTRYIVIPEAVRLTDPRSGEELEGDDGHFGFETLLHKISDNPKWNGSYNLGQCLDAIWVAWEKTPKDPAVGIIIMALEGAEWRELCEAIQNPKQLLISQLGPQIVAGFGLQPRLIRQVLPFCDAVIKADSVDPRGLSAPK